MQENNTVENIINNTNEESNTNTEANTPMENTITNETIENIIIEDTNTVTLDTIHNDLGFICAFLVIASVLVLCRLIYKFFNIFF